SRLEVDDEDVAGRGGQRREGDLLAVGADVRRLGHVDALQLDAPLDLRGDDILENEGLLLLGAWEVGDAIAGGRPRHPGPRVVAEPAGRADVLVAAILVEAAREVADDLA